MKRLLFVSSLLAATAVWADTITFTGATGAADWKGHIINNEKDRGGAYMWSDHQAAHPDGSYKVSAGEWTFFTLDSTGKFNGGSLEIASGYFELLLGRNGEWPITCTIDGLAVDSGARCQIDEDQYKWRGNARNLNGSGWRVDGSLELRSQINYISLVLNAPLSGSGTVTFSDAGGKKDATGFANQVLAADNSAYLGKFAVSLAHISQDEANARGLEISQASALGGALAAPTPDALTLDSGSGLVAAETLTLDTANRGIDLKANAFFDVADGKTLTVKEPIRSEGGFYKRGAGTLVLDSAVTFGADGTAEPDGANSKFEVRVGALRIESATATRDLDVVFSAGAALELPVAACPAGFSCRSLSSSGILDVLVDFQNTGFPSGSSQKVRLFTLPKADALAIANKLNVVAKGGFSTSGLVSTEPAEGGLVSVFAVVTVPQPLTAVTYTGTGGLNAYWNTGGNDINAEKDIDDPGKYLWSDHQAAHEGCSYLFDFGNWAYFSSKNSNRFNGEVLEVASGIFELKLTNPDTPTKIDSFAIDNMIVDAGAQFKFDGVTYMWWQSVTTVTGSEWKVNGELVFAPSRDFVRFSVNAPLSGAGQVTFGGYKDGDWSANAPVNQVLAADNSRFRGKFTVSLAETAKGGDFYSRGIEIADASALGGALAVPTPDALTLGSWNGLIATETLALDTENRGITLKGNAFFEVASNKTLTVAEPIVAEGGFFKRGAGALAFGAAAATCADATPFRMAAGTLRPTGAIGLGKLKTTFAEGTVLELDALDAEPTVAETGFYQPFGWTVESGKLQVSVVFPSGYELKKTKTVVLATVPKDSARALADGLDVRVMGLARKGALELSLEPAEDGLDKIVLAVKPAGFSISVK